MYANTRKTWQETRVIYQKQSELDGRKPQTLIHDSENTYVVTTAGDAEMRKKESWTMVGDTNAVDEHDDIWIPPQSIRNVCSSMKKQQVKGEKEKRGSK